MNSESTPAPAPRFSRRTKWVIGILSIAFLLFLAWSVLVLTVIFSMGDDGLRARPFDAKAWLAPDWKSTVGAESHYHSIRQEMVDDLLEHHLHAGLSRDEVLGLIGEKDPDPYFREPDPEAWIYWLGAERGIGVDYEWLFVSFDERGIVTRAFLATD